MPRKLSIPRKNWDSKMLEERRIQKEKEIQEARLKRQKEDDTKNRVARWVQFALAIWAIRLGLFGFGTAFTAMPSLVTSLSNITGLNMLLFLPQHDLASWPWNRTKKKMALYDCIRKSTPFVTFDVPIESPQIIRNTLQIYSFKSHAKTMPIEVTKGPDCEEFHYQNKISAWNITNTRCSKNVKLLEVSDIPFPYLSPEDRQTCSVDGLACRDDISWYVVEPLHAPLNNPVLSSISKDFQEYIAQGISRMGTRTVQSMLWVSSPGSQCGVHYDMDHNFFLQISGEKTFIITEPSASLVFRGHSYLHPQWRQARAGSPKSIGAILQALDESKSLMDSVFHTDARSPEGPWEVTLYPGDMLFLPAFYYHYTKSGFEGSTSLNVWVSSNARPSMDRLINSASLPFEGDEDVEVKALKLAIMGVLAFGRLGLGPQTNLFLASQQMGLIMIDRHTLTTESLDDVEVDVDTSEKSRAIGSFCSSEVGMKFRRDIYSQLQTEIGVVSPSGAARTIKESASQVASLLVEELKEPAACLHVLLDYIDEVFHSLMQQSSSPESALHYSLACFSTEN